MIAALNRPHEFKLHVRGAINNGLTKDELKEMFLQIGVYCGVPAALDSFRIAKEVFKEMGIDWTCAAAGAGPVAFIGLGMMGLPMASRLLGCRLCGARGRSLPWRRGHSADAGGLAFETARQAAEGVRSSSPCCPTARSCAMRCLARMARRRRSPPARWSST